MDVETAFWSLDKEEIDHTRRYLSALFDTRDETNKIVVEFWAEVCQRQLLTLSILHRVEGHYQIHKDYGKRLGRESVSTSTGQYFEDLIYEPLKALLKNHHPTGAYVVREKTVSLRKETGSSVKKKPDISVLKDGNLLAALECKVWLDRPGFTTVKTEKDLYEANDTPYFAVTTQAGGREVEDICHQLDWLFVLGTKKDGAGHLSPLDNVETLFEKLLWMV